MNSITMVITNVVKVGLAMDPADYLQNQNLIMMFRCPHYAGKMG